MTDDPPPRQPILTAEDVVRRIAVECAFVDQHGGVGIRLRPAAAIVRQYGEQFRTRARRRRPAGTENADPALTSNTDWCSLSLKQRYFREGINGNRTNDNKADHDA